MGRARSTVGRIKKCTNILGEKYEGRSPLSTCRWKNSIKVNIDIEGGFVVWVRVYFLLLYVRLPAELFLIKNGTLYRQHNFINVGINLSYELYEGNMFRPYFGHP